MFLRFCFLVLKLEYGIPTFLFTKSTSLRMFSLVGSELFKSIPKMISCTLSGRLSNFWERA